MMQIISVSWVPTYLIRAYDAPLADVGFLFGNALLVACIGTLAGPMIAERLALRGRKDAVFLVLLVAIPAAALCLIGAIRAPRSEEHTSELQSLMRISYAVFCLKKKK